jgi:hypothetical protein
MFQHLKPQRFFLRSLPALVCSVSSWRKIAARPENSAASIRSYSKVTKAVPKKYWWNLASTAIRMKAGKEGACYDACDRELLDSKINFSSSALGSASRCLFCKSRSLWSGLLVDSLTAATPLCQPACFRQLYGLLAGRTHAARSYQTPETQYQVFQCRSH